MDTKPRRFKSGKEIIDLWLQYCDEIKAEGYTRAPTQTDFSAWLAKNFKATDRRTIYNTLNKIFPEVKDDFDKIRADTIASGAMLGKYHATMTIFALKNWCGWEDKKSVDMDMGVDAIVKFKFDDLPSETTEDDIMG